MTTTVIVKSPKPNHQDLLVELVSKKDRDVIGTQRISEGEEHTFHVHGHADLLITEAEKLPAPIEEPEADSKEDQ